MLSPGSFSTLAPVTTEPVEVFVAAAEAKPWK